MAGRNSYDLTVERGIRQRHENRCGARDGKRCICRPPALIASATVDGTRHYSPTLRSIEAAQRWRGAAISGRIADLVPGLADTGPTVRDVWNRFYAAAVKGGALTKSGTPYGRRTLELYDGAMTTYVLPLVGEAPASGFDGSACQVTIDKLADQGLSPTQQAACATAVRAMSRWGSRRGMGQRISGLELPNVPTRDPRVRSPDEIADLLRMLPPTPVRQYAAIAAYTGARALEVADLVAENVHANSIRIRKGKTAAATRSVPIVAALRPFIAGLPAAGPLFPGAALRSIYAGMQRQLKTTWEDVEARPTLHTLRHNWISWMFAAGVPLPAAQKISGHATPLAPGVTLRVYGHATDDHVEVARRIMDAWIADQSTAA